MPIIVTKYMDEKVIAKCDQASISIDSKYNLDQDHLAAASLLAYMMQSADTYRGRETKWSGRMVSEEYANQHYHIIFDEEK